MRVFVVLLVAALACQPALGAAPRRQPRLAAHRALPLPDPPASGPRPWTAQLADDASQPDSWWSRLWPWSGQRTVRIAPVLPDSGALGAPAELRLPRSQLALEMAGGLLPAANPANPIDDSFFAYNTSAMTPLVPLWLAWMTDVARMANRSHGLDFETAWRLSSYVAVSYCNASSIAGWNCTRCDGIAAGVQPEEVISDVAWDLQGFVGWSEPLGAIVVAFRGTDSHSIYNWVNNMRTWRTDLAVNYPGAPQRALVHGGFFYSYNSSSLAANVTAAVGRLRERHPNAPVYVSGHSLGGALATLAALQVRQQHPKAKLTVMTYGCPRVGNRAFSDLFDQTVPDCWAVINDLDPVPWVPKWCFHRVGKRVMIDGRGNLILRPTYFELAVTHRGTSAKHHLTGSYALSFAAIFRAQFVPSKALPGGAQGVAALAAAVDLSKALQLTNMDIESLRDPNKLPELSEAVAARQAVQRRSLVASSQRQLSRSVSCGGGSLLPPCCSSGPAVVGSGEESRASDMAAEGVGSSQSHRGWWCCGAALPRQAAAARSGSSAAGSQQDVQQQQDGDIQLAEGATALPAPPAVAALQMAATAAAAAAAGAADAAAAAAAGAAADRPVSPRPQGPSKQRSLVHIKRYSSLLLRGSRSTAGSGLSSGAAAGDALRGEQPGGTAGGEGAAGGAPAEDTAEPLTLHTALSHPDSIVLDGSGSWVRLPGGGGSGGPVQGLDGPSGLGRQLTGGRRGSQRYDRSTDVASR